MESLEGKGVDVFALPCLDTWSFSIKKNPLNYLAKVVIFINVIVSRAVVAHTFNPSTWEAEAGGFLSLQPGLQSEFQDRQGYTEKPCLKKNNNKKITTF